MKFQTALRYLTQQHEAQFYREMKRAFQSNPRERFFRRGNESLPVPLLDHARVVDMRDIVMLIPNPFDKISRCDGDEAQLHLLNYLLQFETYCRNHKNTLIIDVGALYGDMGLYTAKHGCRTVLFEPSLYYAAHIARTIQVNGLGGIATIRNEAVSPHGSLKMLEGPIML